VKKNNEEEKEVYANKMHDGEMFQENFLSLNYKSKWNPYQYDSRRERLSYSR